MLRLVYYLKNVGLAGLLTLFILAVSIELFDRYYDASSRYAFAVFSEEVTAFSPQDIHDLVEAASPSWLLAYTSNSNTQPFKEPSSHSTKRRSFISALLRQTPEHLPSSPKKHSASPHDTADSVVLDRPTETQSTETQSTEAPVILQQATTSLRVPQSSSPSAIRGFQGTLEEDKHFPMSHLNPLDKLNAPALHSLDLAFQQQIKRADPMLKKVQAKHILAQGKADYSSKALLSLSHPLYQVGSPVDLTQALLDDVSSGLQMPLLRWVRVSMGDELSEHFTGARFNPLTLKIVISDHLSTLPAAYQRQVLLHEIGHAISFLARIHPYWKGARFEQTNEVLSQSLFVKQVFQESFADLFAIAWPLKHNPADSVAWGDIAKAMSKPELHSSAAHNTFISIRLLNHHLKHLKQQPMSDFLTTLQDVSSEGSAITISHLKVEREAICFMGTRGLVKQMRESYSTPFLPWEMAKTTPLVPQEPYFEALSELYALRSKAPATDPWRNAMVRVQDSLDRALSEGAQKDLSSEQIASLAQSHLMLSHHDAEADERFAAVYSAIALSRSRSSWKSSVYESLFSSLDRVIAAPVEGCPQF